MFKCISVLLVGLLTPGLIADDMFQRAESLSRTEMQSVLQLLGHDLFEGRAPGTRGGDLAEITCQSLFKWMNLVPGWQGQYLQPFTMKAFTTGTLKVEGEGVSLQYLEDVVGNTTLESPDFSLQGEAVFIGFGIKSDIWEWDDFKKADLKDKIVIVRVNDPGHLDEKRFEGNMMTYFGRWRYKIEEAAAQGAKAVLIIHTDESAGYGWHVVQNSWSGEQLYLPDYIRNKLAFRGWIKEASLRRLLARKKIDLDKLYAASMRKNFRPVPLKLSLKIEGKSQFRDIRASNVVAEIPGKSGKRIVLLAHIDHLGQSPTLQGDRIFNGTIDNGAAVTALMLTTRILKEFSQTLNHGITILACQAEEEGLLGSTHYAMTTDRSNILAAINFESTPVWGESRSLMGVGARFSTLEDMLKEIARLENVRYEEFSLNNQGFFYRSDQYPFAQYDIPAVWISAGEDFASGRNHIREFFSGDYHTPRDEYDPDWDLGALKQTVKYALRLVDAIQTAPQPPRWKRRLTFPTMK